MDGKQQRRDDTAFIQFAHVAVDFLLPGRHGQRRQALLWIKAIPQQMDFSRALRIRSLQPGLRGIGIGNDTIGRGNEFTL